MADKGLFPQPRRKHVGKWDKAVAEGEKRWACNTLYDKDGSEMDCNPPETHCALGIIGYVNGGEKFNKAAQKGDGYEWLKKHPKARKMVARLANKLRVLYPEIARHEDDRDCDEKVLRDHDLIIGINDSFGKDYIVTALKEIRKEEKRKARKAKRTRMLNQLRPTPKPIKVEHVTREGVTTEKTSTKVLDTA